MSAACSDAATPPGSVSPLADAGAEGVSSGATDAAFPLPADAASVLPARADAGSHPSDADAGELVVPDLDFSAFDEAVEKFVADNGLEGASAVVVHRDYGAVHHQGYGSYDADRVYLIASSSKVLSVGILMRLADQGMVDLDEPVSTYLSAWGSYKTNVTVAQAFSNSSGLVGLKDNPLYWPYLCQYTTLDRTLADCAKLIYTATDSADIAQPDTAFHYGGGQWQLAGGVGSVVSGKSWAELVRETYVDSCGLTSLGYTNQFQDATFSTLGTGTMAYPAFFSGDPSTLPVTENPSVEGGAYINVSDYGKVLLMHLRQGMCGEERVLSKEAVARMQEDRIGKVYGGSTDSEELEGYGLGWWVDRKHPGVVVDPGLYGAVAYLDVNQKFGAFIAVQGGSGSELFLATKPALDAAFGP